MPPKSTKSQIFENEDTTDEEKMESSSESEESEPEPEYLAPNRSRRANAGNRMAALLTKAHAHDAADEFYDSAYGGFKEEETDENFASPHHSEDDEVDSDFDKSEEEDEAISGSEDKEEPGKRRVDKLREFERNRLYNLARTKLVPENVCDAKTQQTRLKEAKQTEILNIESLKKYQEIELERKRRQIKPVFKRTLNGPYIKIVENASVKTWTFPSLNEWKKPERKEYRVCAVTGRPARYVDPLTELPYSDSTAFKMIRNSYKEFLKNNNHL